MSDRQPLLSEEDIRTKVVYTWLADHGFTPEDISIEFSFEVRLGRGVYAVGSNSPHSPTFRPRADVLVRSSDGRNLLIIEVKAPHEKLDDDAKQQGISYARILRTGGIAPFVVITNGHETQIYDSITEESLEGTRIPINHPHTKNEFLVCVEELELRSQALEMFLSLSEDNLLAFCRTQVAERMRLLKDEDPFSGKKYIPSLYIEREQAKEKLYSLLDEQKRQVVLLIGAPQVGKTNFVCHQVEELLRLGQPCLFYPAIGMENGLMEEISEDFNWILNDSKSSPQLLNKLERILQRNNKKLHIFIDGWNEASKELARKIDKGSERIISKSIHLVVSFTNVAARRLLLDEAGNLCHFAESASISVEAVSQMEVSPEKIGKRQSRIFLDRYSQEEMRIAYKKYADFFNVNIPENHNKVEEPLLLRIGMEQYKDSCFPETLNEPKLIEKSMTSKALRCKGIKEEIVITYLQQAAHEIFVQDAPVKQENILKRCGLPIVQSIPDGLFEAALLAKVCDSTGFPKIDFYYSRERDFAISFWSRNWFFKFSEKGISCAEELLLAVQTQAARNALRWFLSEPNHTKCLKKTFQSFHEYEDPRIREILLSSLYEYLKWNSECILNLCEQKWITDAVDVGVNDADRTVKIQAAKLLVVLNEKHAEIFSIFAPEEIQDLVIALLSVDSDFPLSDESVILDSLYSLHVKNTHSWNSASSNISNILQDIMSNHIEHRIRYAAAKGLAHISPEVFLDSIWTRLRDVYQDIYFYGKAREIPMEYIEGIEIGIIGLANLYLGSDSGFGCPPDIGTLEEITNDTFKSEEEICLELLSILQKIQAYYLVFSSLYGSRNSMTQLQLLIKNILSHYGSYFHACSLKGISSSWTSVLYRLRIADDERYTQLELNLTN